MFLFYRRTLPPVNNSTHNHQIEMSSSELTECLEICLRIKSLLNKRHNLQEKHRAKHQQQWNLFKQEIHHLKALALKSQDSELQRQYEELEKFASDAFEANIRPLMKNSNVYTEKEYKSRFRRNYPGPKCHKCKTWGHRRQNCPN